MGLVTEQYGTLGLYTRLQDTFERTGLHELPEVQWATQFGLMLHANQTRTNGHYTDHIMRVALRIVEHFEITDPAIVCGALLHDGVEDHPKDTVLALTGQAIEDVGQAREVALDLIATHTSDETAQIVTSVTNPLCGDSGDKQAIYNVHTRKLILKEPKARVVKLSDFIDNAVGNHFTQGGKQQKLDLKYLSQYRWHRLGLFLPDSLITGEVRERVLHQLTEGHARTLARLALAG